MLVPWFQFLNGKDTSHPPAIKTYLFDQPLIKYDIFEEKVTFPPRGTPIVIVNYYCEHHNMTYISQSDNNIPWNR